MTQFLNVCCFSKCYFCEISQGCKSTLLGIPTTTMSCNNSVSTVSETVLDCSKLENPKKAIVFVCAFFLQFNNLFFFPFSVEFFIT